MTLATFLSLAFKVICFILKWSFFIFLAYMGIGILAIIFLILYSILNFIIDIKSKIKCKARKIKNKIKNKIEEKRKPKVLTYNIEESKKYGFNLEEENPKFHRPIPDRLLEYLFSSIQVPNRKYNKYYKKAKKSKISIKQLKKKKTIRNKTITGFVDKVVGDEITLINSEEKITIKVDNLYNLKTKKGTDNIYSIAGEFVCINLTKRKDKIKINYILIN